jgi:hypothetical protein
MTDTLDKQKLTKHLELQIHDLNRILELHPIMTRDFNIIKTTLDDLLLKIHAGRFDC